MLPSLFVAAAISAPGAPVPKDSLPNTTGPAPRVVAVKSDANGSVWITAQVWEKRKVQQQIFIMENGKQVMKQQEVEQNHPNYIHKAIGEFGGKFWTADGTSVSTEDATRRLKGGAMLLVTADGKPIDQAWLPRLRTTQLSCRPRVLLMPTSSSTSRTPPILRSQQPHRPGWPFSALTRRGP